MAYRLLKIVIARGNFDRADIMDKLDAYYAFGRISTEQYNELMTSVSEADSGA